MESLKAIDEIEIEGYPKQKLYRRVVALEEANMINPRRGAANAILLDQKEIHVLQKLISLEANCRRTGTAIEKLRYELTIEENGDLKSKIQQKDNEIKALTTALAKREHWFRRIWKRLFMWFPRKKQEVRRTESANS